MSQLQQRKKIKRTDVEYIEDFFYFIDKDNLTRQQQATNNNNNNTNNIYMKNMKKNKSVNYNREKERKNSIDDDTKVKFKELSNDQMFVTKTCIDQLMSQWDYN